MFFLPLKKYIFNGLIVAFFKARIQSVNGYDEEQSSMGCAFHIYLS